MKIHNMARCALFAGLLALCAWFTLPTGTGRLTLQTFGVFLALGVLGGRLGCCAISVYLLLGCTGMPVFSGFQGGIGILLGPTGGFLLGFLAAGGIYLIITALLGDTPGNRLAAMIAGQAVCYAIGTVWYWLLYGGSMVSMIMVCVLPYLLPDGIKLVLAWHLSNRLRRFLL